MCRDILGRMLRVRSPLIAHPSKNGVSVLITNHFACHSRAPDSRREWPRDLQLSNADVYLNGATTIAVSNFRRAAQKESGILKDDAESNPFRGTAGLGGNFAQSHPAQSRVIRRHVGAQAPNSRRREIERLRPGRGARLEGAAESRHEWFGVTCANEGIELREAGNPQAAFCCSPVSGPAKKSG